MSFGQQVLCTQQGSTILYANQDLAEMEKKKSSFQWPKVNLILVHCRARITLQMGDID